jgi:hypothetical protein
MKEKIKDQIRENVYTMTDRFANTDFDLQSSQIREMNTVITELLFDLSLPSRKDTGRTTSLIQSDVYKELYNLIEIYQEKVDDGKSSDTEFDKLISSLQYNLEGLLSNHDVNPVVYLGESGNVEFSKALTQDDLENKLVDEVVVATEEQGGMNIQNPTSLKEAETNPRFSLNQWCYNVASTYFQDGPEAALNYTSFYKLSHRQENDGYTEIFLQKAGAKLVEINPDLLSRKVRKTKDELTQQEKDLSQAINNFIKSQSEEELRGLVREGRNEFFYESDFNVDEEIAEFILDNTILGQRKATKNSDDLLELAINSYINGKSRKQLEDLVREYKDTFFYESDFGTTEERQDFILEYGTKTGLESRKKQVLEFIFEGTLVLTADQVSTPEDPSQQEVMDLISNITTIKELGSFIRSTTFATGDKRELNRQKVVGFINELRLEVSSTAQSKNNPQAGNKKNSPKNTQPL